MKPHAYLPCVGVLTFVLTACGPAETQNETKVGEDMSTMTDDMSGEIREPKEEFTFPGDLVVYLSIEGEGSFCSGMQIGPRHILTIEHCAGTIKALPDKTISVGYGTDARRAPKIETRVKDVHIFARMEGAPEGIALVETREDPKEFSGVLKTFDWSSITLTRPDVSSEVSWESRGFGFHCDSRDETCCDPRVQDCTGQENPWGLEKPTQTRVIAHHEAQIVAHPIDGDSLCAGDSGSILWRTEGGKVLVGGVYHGSYLPAGVTLEGTGLEGRARVCTAFGAPKDMSPSEQLGVYASIFVDPCAHAKELRERVPTLSNACETTTPMCEVREDLGYTEQALSRLQSLIKDRLFCEAG